ncbi:MAG: hypothetical protein SFU53_06720 [Terrimicrobiaceae bacterium]|nr:hypothetical protein [Terrimicrobiaceae bacterium]
MLRSGKILLVGEYRGHRVETIRYVDKKTGQKSEFVSLVYLVERGNGSDVVLVSQDPRTKNPEEVKVSAQKGKVYAFELTNLDRERGMIRARMQPGVEPVPA